MQLRGHIAVLDDGADNQLREEQHIRRKGDGVFLGLHLAGVNISFVADNFKDVVADAQGQHRAYIQGGQAKIPDAVQGIDQEIGILKVDQRRQVDQHRHGRQQAFQFGFGARCQQPPQVVEYDQADNQRQIFYTGPAVEQQAFHQQHHVFAPPGDEVVRKQRQRQKAEQEHNAVKNHPRDLLSFVYKNRPLPSGVAACCIHTIV